MTQTTQTARVHEFHTLPKDIGVMVVLFVALALAYLLRAQVDGHTATFKDPSTPFAITYPATWGRTDAPPGTTLRVENPRTNSTFKSSLTVESRGLDPTSPPTLQQLVDRRVRQHGTLTAYHLLSSGDATVGGVKAMRQEYAYVVQPIDEPRRASLPVVVHAIEYIVVTKDNVFYITLAAPDSDFADASARFDEMLETVRVQ